MRYIVGRVALIRRYRATFSQWEKAPSTVFKIYLGQLWSQTAPTICNLRFQTNHANISNVSKSPFKIVAVFWNPSQREIIVA